MTVEQAIEELKKYSPYTKVSSLIVDLMPIPGPVSTPETGNAGTSPAPVRSPRGHCTIVATERALISDMDGNLWWVDPTVRTVQAAS